MYEFLALLLPTTSFRDMLMDKGWGGGCVRDLFLEYCNYPITFVLLSLVVDVEIVF
jgi:hypothetical protein